MDIEELQEGYLRIISILEECKNTLEVPKQRHCVSNIIREFKLLYNRIMCDYNKDEFAEIYDADMTEVFADNKEWRIIIKKNHWSFYRSFTTDAICPPAYETHIKESLDYYPCNNENVIEWYFDAYDFGAFDQQEGSKYNVRITHSGEFINY